MDVYDHQVLKLTPEFYLDYPNPPYTEIELKPNRRYNCLIIQSHYDYFICIPFRSQVRHKYAYHFRNSARSRIGKSALDYSKSVIIRNTEYIDTNPGIIDSDEYAEMMRNMDRIVDEVLKYVDDYVSYQKMLEDHISEQEYLRRYKYSTLRYFHDILGIDA
ncbi:MAG: hypothetical protein IJ058_09310 [Lachnospiraceae bacterium]|nr:hypothetical protein [Lachnospiraceae bacterium]